MTIHPRWFDDDFWEFVSQQLMRLDVDAMRQRAKRKAAKG